MPLPTQCLVNLSEICATERSWKDLHIEGIKLPPPPSYMRRFTTPTTFGTFSLCTFRFKWISDNKQRTKSCKFSSSLGLYPKCMRNKKILNVFFLFHFGHFSVLSETSSIPVSVIYGTPEKLPFKWSTSSHLLT